MQGKLLILGKNGQVGRALTILAGEQAITCDRQNINLENRNFVQKLDTLIQSNRIAAVINAAAYTQVDKAEDDNVAWLINAEATAQLASWCKTHDLPLIHYSTDYVFDGNGETARDENAEARPINRYGASKRAGEHAIEAEGGRYIILRTSWVYDALGKNFFTTMLRLMNEKPFLNVVSDQHGAPTYAPHLAVATLRIIEIALQKEIFPSGTYHLCNKGETTWFDFAQAIFTLATSQDSIQVSCQRINPIASSAYPLPAKRPLNSRLDCAKVREVFGISMPEWEIGLNECFEHYANTRLSH